MSVSRTPTEVFSAIDTVARHVARNAVFAAIEDGRTEWGNYPELSQADWERVSFRARELAEALGNQSNAFYKAAYDLLSERAGDLS